MEQNTSLQVTQARKIFNVDGDPDAMPLMENETQTIDILIVDDDPDTCTLLETLFQVKGYTTRAVYSGQDALERMDTDEPNAVVLDVMMPEMDGWETFSKFARSNVPVLFLTALSSGEYATRALLAGVNDYVRKPFHPSELLVAD